MQWPPDYVSEFARRQQLIFKLRNTPGLAQAAKSFYAKPENCGRFINDWCVTYDPRNAGSALPPYMPFLTFPRQDDFLEFLCACMFGDAPGLVEKSRDLGATWLAVAFSVWLWLFLPGTAVGWGSRKEQLVDKLGDPSSIFEKIRILVRYMPVEFLPLGFKPKEHLAYMKIINPETGSTITGESGDNIGRGGRTRIFFKDESAHYEHPEAIEAALGDNTRVQFDISSVHGLGNVFHRRREAGVEWRPGATLVRDRANVFIFDWSDHPAKTPEWHAERKAKAVSEGLLHVFASEVDRDYAASVEGVIVPAEWVASALDAHKKLEYLGDWNAGLYGAALDVADEGLDKNALCIRQGSVIRHLAEWGERDTGATTRRAVTALDGLAPIVLQYDCVGVGAGVKAEANRLKDDGLLPRGIAFAPWNGGAAVQNGWKRVVENDPESPLAKDYFTNLKAQAWWELRLRFERTHRAVTEGEAFDVDELIALPSDLPLIRSAQRELSQPTIKLGTKLKLLIDKKPDGAKSPNLGDVIAMAFWPIEQAILNQALSSTYTVTGGR